MSKYGLFGLVFIACTACTNGSNDGTDTDTDTDTDTGPVFETGCILVDGQGGYKWLGDALTLAEDGSEIELCEDIEESLVIDKQVTLLAEGLSWIPPVNKPAALVVDGGGLTVSGINVLSTRSGFTVDAWKTLVDEEPEDGSGSEYRDQWVAFLTAPGTASLNLDTAYFEDIPNYGILSIGGDITLTDTSIIYPSNIGSVDPTGYSAISLDGGTLNATRIDIQDASAYGIYAEGGATINLIDSFIWGTLYTGNSNDLFEADGVGLAGSEGTVITSEGNQFFNNGVTAMRLQNSELEATSDLYELSFAGLIFDNTTVSLSGTEVSSYLQYGIFGRSCDSMVFDSVAVIADPETSAQNITADPEAGIEEAVGSIGILTVDSNLTISGSEELPSVVQGNNGVGITMEASSAGSPSITMDWTNVINNARFGLVTFNGEMTLRNVNILDTRNDDGTCVSPDGNRCNMAIAAWGSDLNWDGGSVSGSGSWGLTVVNGSLEGQNLTITDNEDFGVFCQASVLNIGNSTFHAGGQRGVYANGCSGLFDSLTFNDNHYTSVNETPNEDGSIRRTEYSYNGLDIQTFASNFTIQNSTFTEGDQGIYGSGGSGDNTINIDNVQMDQYNYYPVFGTSGGEVNVKNSTFSNIGSYANYCSYGASLSLDNVSIQDVTAYKYKYVSYTDDVETYRYEYENPGYPLYANQCNLEMNDVTISNVEHYGAQINNSAIEMDGVVLENIGNALSGGLAIQYYMTDSLPSDGITDHWSYPDIEMNDVTVKGVPGTNGFSFTGWVECVTKASDGSCLEENIVEGTVILSDLSAGGNGTGDALGNNGLHFTDMHNVQLMGVDVQSVGNVGMFVKDSTLEATGASATLSGTISNAPGHGIQLVDSTISLTDMTVLDANGSGILTDGGTLDLDNCTVTNANYYGMFCQNEPTINTCDGTFDGGSGEFSDCGGACLSE